MQMSRKVYVGDPGWAAISGDLMNWFAAHHVKRRSLRQLAKTVANLSGLSICGRESMRKAQQGDQVQVHYVKRYQDGSTTSSRGRSPLEVTVGTAHPRLPGLGLALVGLAAGEFRSLRVPPERAYGMHDPSRVRPLDRRCFSPDKALPIGKWVRVMGRRGRRWVRVLELREDVVLVDYNRRGAGQALDLEVELIAILEPAAGQDNLASNPDMPTNAAGTLHPTAKLSSGDADDGTRSGHRV
jgi:peptidylprolyl isomerase